MSVYKNGNTIVEIKNDGTKIRYIPDNVPAKPEYPESIDLKITNKCEKNPPCPWCHEQSESNGNFADLNHPLLNSLMPFIELAIGGGDPMTHPDLESFLEKMKKKRVFCNITVHWTSFLENYETLKRWTNEKKIHGLGVSINSTVPSEVIEKLMEFPLAVVHTIIGISGKSVYEQLMDKNLNILLLGYKTFGRGIKFRTTNSISIAQNAVWLKNNLSDFTNHFRVVSFDNLAIEQTDLRNHMTDDMFDQIYMGNDGSFTMYIDLVEEKFAASSTKERHPINSTEITELFKQVRRETGNIA